MDVCSNVRWRCIDCHTWIMGAPPVEFESGRCERCFQAKRAPRVSLSQDRSVWSYLSVEECDDVATDSCQADEDLSGPLRIPCNFVESDDDYLERIWLERQVVLSVVPEYVPFYIVKTTAFAPLRLKASLAAPLVSRSPPKVGGSGNCWQALFPYERTDVTMTVYEFVRMVKESVHFTNHSTYLQVELQNDLDLHLCAVYTGMTFGRRTMWTKWGTEDGPSRVRPDGLMNIADIDVLTNYADSVWRDLTLIGAPRPPAGTKKTALGAMDVLNNPTAWVYSGELVRKLANWWWEHRKMHLAPPTLPKGPLEDMPVVVTPPSPPDLPPIVHLPPTVPPPADLEDMPKIIGPDNLEHMPTFAGPDDLEHMPHFSTPPLESLEALYSYLAALASELGDHVREAFDAFLDALREHQILADNSVLLLIFELPRAIAAFAADKVKHFLAFLKLSGVEHLFDNLVSQLSQSTALTVLRTLLSDALSMTSGFLHWGFFGIKVINFLFQDFTEYHGPEFVYRRSLIRGELDFKIVDLEGSPVYVANTVLATEPTARMRKIVSMAADYGNLELKEGASAESSKKAGFIVHNIMKRVHELKQVVLPEDTPEDDLRDFARAMPDRNVCRGVVNHPHPRPQAIRSYFRDVANAQLSKRGKPVRAVGASNTEAPGINNLIHNCWPTLTGRDEYRKRNFQMPQHASVYALTADHRFEECDHNCPSGDVYGADIWSFYSAHDISPETFIREMAISGSDTAVIALNLPFPLMDRRVNSYVDTLAGLAYEVENDKLIVWHLDGHSAGYVHDFENVLRWMSPLPTFTNAHVQAEAIAQVGTSVLLQLTIGRGSQEVVPSLWSCQKDPFYQLPYLYGGGFKPESGSHFSVPARKFEQLTAFVSGLPPTQQTLEFIMPKLRGMMAEIKIGVHSVEPRWSVTLPQMYSLIHHAILAHRVNSRSANAGASLLESYFKRVDKRNSGIFNRWVMGLRDSVCSPRGEANPLDPTPGFFARLVSYKYAHRETFNPYVRAGTYKIANLDARHSQALTSPKMALRVSTNCAKSVWSGFLQPVWFVTGAIAARSQRKPALPKPWSSALGYTASAHYFANAYPYASPQDDSDSSSSSGSSSRSSAGTEATEEIPEPVQPQSQTSTEIKRQAFGVKQWVEETADVDDFRPPSEAAPPNDPETEEWSTPAIIAPQDRAPVAESIIAADDDLVKDLSDVSSQPGSSRLSEAPAPAEPIRAERTADPVPAWLKSKIDSNSLRQIRLAEYIMPAQRVMSFDAPLLPAANYHPADAQIHHYLSPTGQFRWPASRAVIGCPSNGACRLLDAAYKTGEFELTAKQYPPPAQHGYKIKDIEKALLGPEETAEELKAIAHKVAVEANEYKKTAVRCKTVAIVGPPRCAKSSLLRVWLTTSRKTAVVYVPSKHLRESWKEYNYGNQVKVFNRNQLLTSSKASYDVGVIDEIFNFSPLEVNMMVRHMVIRAKVKMVVLLGDRFQHAPGGVQFDSDYFFSTIEMHTSLGMPQDAHDIFVKTNRLDPAVYESTGTRQHSIYIATEDSALEGYHADLRFQNHGYAGREDLTVGKVQGARCKHALFIPGGKNPAGWLNDNPAYKSVAFTRHSDTMVIRIDRALVGALFPYTEPATIVNGQKVDTKHLTSPYALDNLVVSHVSDKVRAREARLRAILQQPMPVDGHKVVLLRPDEEPADPIATVQGVEDLQALVYEQTNFELPEPNEIDFVTSPNKVPFTMQQIPPPVQRTDVRNDLDGSHKLAAIHSNVSAFDAAKNIIDRQIATTKKPIFRQSDIDEGVRIFERFRECFMKDSATVLDIDATHTWIRNLDAAALATLASSDPLGEFGSSLTCDAEFKTQTKAKAEPGFAATLPYGQSIIANKKIFNAHFAEVQPRIYTNMKKLLRPGVIMDYGMSDAELSHELRSLGVAEHMAGPQNFQADVSKQDSSHTPAFLIAFLLTAQHCGADQETLNFYLAYCQQYRVVSRGVDGIKTTISYNLGSGDPFTLIRNNHMEMCVIAVRYVDAKTMVIVEKGDDVHGWMRSVLMRSLKNFPSVRAVKLKVDYGAVGYHAGRFHNGHRYLVDPVRAFLKHFTRLSDENVSVKELHKSYISRATDYSEGDVEFLIPACQAHYPYFNTGQIVSMIETVLRLRNFATFEKYSKLRVPPAKVIVDNREGCLTACVRAMYPRMPRGVLREFSNLSFEDAIYKLKYHGIPFHLTSQFSDAAELGVIQLTRTHARVTIPITGPPMAFKTSKAKANYHPDHKITKTDFLYDQL